MNIASNFLSNVRRVAAVASAHILIGRDALILDTETTDLDGYAVEVAVVSARTGRTVFHALINPDHPISDEARGVHRIDDREISDCPRWAEILGDLYRVLDGRVVIAYNARFDRAVLAREAARAQVREPSCRWVCASELRSRFECSTRWFRLDGGHRAVQDCLATRRLLQQVAAGQSTLGRAAAPTGI